MPIDNVIMAPRKEKMELSNVKRFGATGNGTTDDTTAILAAIAYASANSRYAIYFPTGTYLVSGTIQVPSNFEVFGDGPTSVIKLADGGNVTLTGFTLPEVIDSNSKDTYPIIITDQTGATTGIYLHDFSVEGNSANLTTTSIMLMGIVGYNTSNMRVERVNVDDINKSITVATGDANGYRNIGLCFMKSTECSVVGGVFGDCGYESVGVRGGCNGISFYDVTISKTYSMTAQTAYGKHGFQSSMPTAYPTKNVVVSGMKCRGRGTKVITHRCSKVLFDNIDIEGVYDTGGVCINVLGSAVDVTISNCRIYQHGTPDPAGFTGIQVRGTSAGETPRDVQIVNCLVDSVLAAIDIDGGKNVTISGCDITCSARACINADAGSGAFENFKVNDCHCSTTGSNTYHPIVVTGADGCLISGCMFDPVSAVNCVKLDGGTGIVTQYNDFSHAAGGAVAFTSANSPVMLHQHNIGYTANNYGTATLVSGQTTKAVSHGCNRWMTVNEIVCTPVETLGNASFFWITDTGNGTQFTINVNTDPGADVDFAWSTVPRLRA